MVKVFIHDDNVDRSKTETVLKDVGELLTQHFERMGVNEIIPAPD